MIQEIITYLILVLTLAIAIKRLYKFVAKKSPSACESCFQAQSGCKLAEIKKVAQIKHI